DHLGAACGDRVEHDLAIGIAGAAEKQPRRKFLAGNDQRIGHRICSYPPCRARTISTLSPGLSRVAGQAARGTTAPLSATAMPRCPMSTVFSVSTAPRFFGAANGSLSPLTRISVAWVMALSPLLGGASRHK